MTELQIQNDKRDRRRGAVATLIAMLLIAGLLLLLFIRWTEPWPPQNGIEMFSGGAPEAAEGGSAAGDPEPIIEPEETSASATTAPVVTSEVEEPSVPIKKDPQISESKVQEKPVPKPEQGKEKVTPAEKPKKKADPRYDFGSSVKNTGEEGDGDGKKKGKGIKDMGDGDADGPGGVGDGEGGLFGSDRGLIGKPTDRNTCNAVGTVYCEIEVDDQGKVVNVWPKRTHPKTKTNNTCHFTMAKQVLLKKRLFEADPGSENLRGFYIINFTFQE